MSPATSLRTTPAKLALYALMAVAIGCAAYYDVEIAAKGCRMTTERLAALPRTMDVDEYVPRTVSLEWMRKMEEAPDGPQVSSINPSIPVTIDIKRWGPQDRLFVVDQESGTRLAVRTFRYPGWRALLDGAEVVTSSEPVTGAILIDVPPGKHEVRLVFGETPTRYAAWLLSGLAMLILVYLMMRPQNYAAETRKGTGV